MLDQRTCSKSLTILFAGIALLAGCGGGGGSTSPGVTPPVTGAGTSAGSGGATSTPSTAPSASPSTAPTHAPSTPAPTASPAITTSASIGGAAIANGIVVYSCGCSNQAGTTTTDAAGNFTLSPTATAIPASPSPTYTMVPGRNYVIVAKAQSSTASYASGAEAWTVAFLGTTPSHNLGLGPSGALSMDKYATAAALYAFYVAPLTGNKDLSMNQFNFNALLAWANYLRTSSSLSAPEQKLLSDIDSAQATGNTLFPRMPYWYPGTPLPPTNSAVVSDLQQIQLASGNTSDPIPTPCPGGVGSCTGTPSP
jgi:hypothetical protein